MMRATIAGAVLVGLGAASASARQAPAATPKPAAEGAPPRLAAQAEAARKAGRTQEAVDLYKKGLAQQPGWIDGHWGLATLLYDLDRYDEAQPEFAKVVAANPRDGVPLAMHGLCEAQLHQYERALKDLSRARQLGIRSVEVGHVALFQEAVLLNRFERYENAFELLRPFVLAGEDSVSVIEAIGLSMLRLPFLPSEVPADKREMILLAGRGGYQLAMPRANASGRLAFEELVSRYPGAANVHYAYGTFLLREDPDAALREFQRALELAPDDFRAMTHIALEQVRRGQAEDGLAVARQAVAAAPSFPVARLALGRVLLETGDAAGAIVELERGAALSPESSQIHFSLSRAYQKAGRAKDAERERAEFQRLEEAGKRTSGSAPAGTETGGATPPSERK